MDIEELAFKDRTQLAHLNELDLLDIIEFLQFDRKQWINQFTQTHNRSVDIQKENKELKKQVDEYKKLGFKHLVDKNNNLETQQKEFINYLEDEIKDTERTIELLSDTRSSRIPILQYKKHIIEVILAKYKEIIQTE